MPKALYDTRFFIEYFYSDDENLRLRAKDFLARNKERYVSAITLHELYLLDLTRRGRDVAKLNRKAVQDLFLNGEVTSEIAVIAAELRHKYRIPMADSLIAATCRALGAQCITDDPHLAGIKEIKTRWI